MRRFLWKRACIALLAAGMVFSAAVGEYPRTVWAESSVQEDKKDYENLKNQMGSINDRLNQLNKDIAQAKADKASVLKQKQLLDQQIAAIGEKIELSVDLIAACDQRIQETQKQIDELDQKILDDYEIIRRRLIFAQETGDMEYIDFLLGSASLSDLLSRVEVMNDLFANDEKVLQALTLNRDEVSSKKAELEATKQQSVALKEENEVQKTELENKKKEAEDYLKSIEKDVQTLSKTQKEVQAAKNQLDADMKALAAQIKEKEEREYKGGAFIWPVPVKYKRISQQYKGSSHTGIDIPTSGTPVNAFATASGKVVVAGWHWSYGNYVVIYHGSGMQSLYAHLDKIYVKVNQEVKQGHVIGLTGNTGYSFGVHLHFMIYVDGSHVNPLKYVTAP